LSLIQRFQGDHGRSQLIEVLRDQKIVSGNVELAQRIAEAAELIDVPAETAIIQQDHEDNDVFLIIAGAFDVSVNGMSRPSLHQ
jgi:CRP/FNR family cyclic AMP-dependent transcriptional regulator